MRLKIASRFMLRRERIVRQKRYMAAVHFSEELK